MIYYGSESFVKYVYETYMTRPRYTFVGKCRTTKRGGGVGLMHRSALHLTQVKTEINKTFEYLDVRSTNTPKPLRIIVVYRTQFLQSDHIWMNCSYFSEVPVTLGDLVIARGFKLHYEQGDASGVSGSKELLAENNLQQHVSQPSHRIGLASELVISGK